MTGKRDTKYDEVDKSRFLTGLGRVLKKHGLTWDDVDIDVEKGIVDVKVDMESYEVVAFLTEIEKTAGIFN